ncbi:MAG: family ATP-binding cassette protein [Chloroflexi bacterium]|nr:family ATP-binding cassette protein [Chloroflexota bacterium]
MLQLKQVAYGTATRQLFRDVSFTLGRGEKVGLVGVNGAGKTTLLRLVMGEVAPDSGSVIRPDRVGYVPQKIEFDLTLRDQTVYEYVAEGRGLITLQRRLDELSRGLGQDQEAAGLPDYGKVLHAFEAAGGWQAKATIGASLARLGMSFVNVDAPLSDLSGGQRARIAIARALFADPELLVLDEPTNHLDPAAKEWLMSYLGSCKSTVFMVSHDLQLLDRSISAIFHLNELDQRVHSYRGTYSQFTVLKSAATEQLQRTLKVQRQKVADLKTSAASMGASQKQASRRNNIMRRATELESALPEAPKESRAIKFKFPPLERSQQVVVQTQKLHKSYGKHQVVPPLSLTVERGERIAVTGVNGAGKTTLLKLVARQIEPTGGTVDISSAVTMGYYSQEQEQLDPQATVLEEVRFASSSGDGPLRGMLAQFGFYADSVFQPTRTLSGGERSRLCLCKLVLQANNLLLLDEPTNNLDPSATRQVLQALLAYEGAMLLVSHDAEFVRALAPNRLIVMPQAEIRLFS